MRSLGPPLRLSPIDDALMGTLDEGQPGRLVLPSAELALRSAG